MKYVVTGATSFLGQVLVRHLILSGHQVVAVCRHDSPLIAQLSVEAEVVTADMSDYGNLHQTVFQADVWINLAWKGTSHDGRDVVDVQKANVIHTVAAMNSASHMGCQLFVEAGSQAEYGTVLTSIAETTPCHPFSEYGRAKLEVKERLSELASEKGMKYLHLRIFSLFGENDHPWTLVMGSIKKMLADEPVDLSPCTQQWNFLYVDDAARQIAILCDYALQSADFGQEVFNIASDDSRPLSEFVERMKVLSGSRSQLNYGAVSPQHIVSLRPDMRKTSAVVKPLCQYTFDDIIQKIIQSLCYDKSK